MSIKALGSKRFGLAQLSVIFVLIFLMMDHMFYWYPQEDERNNDGWEKVQKKPTKRHQQVIV